MSQGAKSNSRIYWEGPELAQQCRDEKETKNQMKLKKVHLCAFCSREPGAQQAPDYVTADIDMSLKDYSICVNIFKMEATANILKNSTNKTG